MLYRIAIADDNPADVEYVTALVKCWAKDRDYSVKIEAFPSAEAFLFTYDEDKAWDVLLLDIEMSGKNGVELAKMVRQENETVQIVFVTGFPDYLVEGYEVSALHYLMKPVSQETLYTVLDRAVDRLKKAEKRLCVRFDGETEYVMLSRISFVEAKKQYVDIHTLDRTYRMKASLSELEKGLDEYFFRCQRSFLVNLQQIKRIKSASVVLKNGEEVPISRGMAEKIGKEIIRLL